MSFVKVMLISSILGVCIDSLQWLCDLHVLAYLALPYAADTCDIVRCKKKIIIGIIKIG